MITKNTKRTLKNIKTDMNDRILLTALSQYGVKEIVGAQHNDKILRYFAAAGHSWVKDDETAWCSAFVNWVAAQCGCEKSGSLAARSWLEVGDVILENEVQQGDLAIFWRVKKDSVYGHVGFFIAQTKDTILTLGGNQSNMITISPYLKSQWLGYRRLKLLNT